MIRKLYYKYKEIIRYVFFGVMTTVVNFAVYWLFNRLIGEELYLVNNVIAWVVAVAFAYITNKLWVFDSKSLKPGVLLREIGGFVAARLFSLGVEEGGLWLLVDKLRFDKYSFNISSFNVTGKLIAKVILAVIVVILNYFFSKFIIFAKKKTDGGESVKSEKENS